MSRNMREMTIVLNGKMGQGLKAASAELTGRLKEINSRMTHLDKARVGARQLTGMEAGVENARKAFVNAQTEVDRLRRELKATKQPTSELVSAFEDAKVQSSLLKKELSAQTTELTKTKRAIQATGYSASELTADTRRLDMEMASAKQEADGLRKNLGRLESQQMKTGTAAEGLGKRMLGGISGMARGVWGLAAAYLGVQAAQGVVFNAGQYEDANTSFEVMLRSASKAKVLLKDLSKFAATTPYEFPEIQGAAKSLLAFGVGSQDVTKKLRMLGDIASGVSIPLGDIADIYGKAKTQGRLFAEDINQLTGRGIPIIQELAKQFGVSESKVRGLVEKGKVGFKELDKALYSLTTGTGRFAGMTERKSKGLLGLWSTLKDGINMAMVEETNKAMPNMKRLLQWGIDHTPELVGQLDKAAVAIEKVGKSGARAFSWYKKHASVLNPVLVTTGGLLGGFALSVKAVKTAHDIGRDAMDLYRSALDAKKRACKAAETAQRGLAVAVKAGKAAWGVGKLVANRVATLAVAAAQRMATAAQKGWTIAMRVGRGVLSVGKLVAYRIATLAVAAAQKVWAGAQWLVNAAMNANPIGLIIAGVLALATGVYLLVKNWKKVKSALLGAWHWFVKFATEGPGRFIPIIGQIGQIAKNWDKVKKAALAVWNALKKVWDIVNKIGGKVITAVVRTVTGKESSPVAKSARAARSGAKPKVHARGGIVQRPTLSWVGEAGPEAIIPLQGHRTRAQALWADTGRQLGFAGAGGGISVTVPVSITIQGNATREEVAAGVSGLEDKIRRVLDNMMRDQRRRSMD
ncbi:MAG: tape measure protein [Armatimonadota bacterium]|nr:tape measure protein [bacterium]